MKSAGWRGNSAKVDMTAKLDMANPAARMAKAS
jgi:hypothetical protein